MVEELTGTPQRWSYVEQNRSGDHICYYSDLRKIKAHYPAWDIARPLEEPRPAFVGPQPCATPLRRDLRACVPEPGLAGAAEDDMTGGAVSAICAARSSNRQDLP